MIQRKLVSAAAVAVALLASIPAFAERGDDSQRKSKNGRTEGAIAGVAITLEYGRPGVQGRSIWGSVVPYGKVWRTGADEATTITFSKAVKIEGQALPAGTYSLFTIPGEKEWTVIFNKVAQQWGAYKYDAAQDALRVTVAPAATEAVENLDFVLQGDKVVARWDKVAVGFRVSAAD